MATEFTSLLSWNGYGLTIDDSRTGVSNSVTGSMILVGTNAVNRIKNPNYRYQIAERQDASTPYYRAKWRNHVNSVIKYETLSPRTPSQSYILKTKVKAVTRVGCSPQGTTDASLEDACIKKMRRKLLGLTSFTDAAVPIGEMTELKKTINGSIKLTTTFLETLLDLKKKHGKSKKALSYAADAWLNYSFGIAPTVKSVQDISSSIMKYFELQSITTRVEASSGTGKMWSVPLKWTIPGWVLLKGTSSGYATLSYRGVAGYDFNALTQVQGLYEQLGLDSLKVLVPVAWELFPFSWVADYYGTIGDALDAWAHPLPGRCIYFNVTRLYRCNIDDWWEISPVPGSGHVLTSTSFSPGHAEYVECQRTIYPGLPAIQARPRNFAEIARYAGPKLSNLFAILAQAKR